MGEKGVQDVSGDHVYGDNSSISIHYSFSNVPPDRSSFEAGVCFTASKTMNNSEREYWEWS